MGVWQRVNPGVKVAVTQVLITFADPNTNPSNLAIQVQLSFTTETAYVCGLLLTLTLMLLTLSCPPLQTFSPKIASYILPVATPTVGLNGIENAANSML